METGQRRERARIGNRRPRMSEAQTREAALRTTVAEIRENGLPLGLEHLSMEDVIREAEVSRTAFYRLWPQKDQFIGDLIVELAKEALPTQNTQGAEATSQLKESLLPRIGELQDADARWQLIINLVVSATTPDFERTASLAGQWRTYFALTSLTMSLPDSDVKEIAQQEIGNAEKRYRERLVANYALSMNMFGIRLRGQLDMTLDDVADLLIALIRGLVLRNRADSPSRSSSLASRGAAAIVAYCFENDPTVLWDDSRIDAIRATLNGTADLF